jgi:hypothetical protein
VVPGDYDGDGKTDICVARDFNIGTNPPTPVKWYIKYTGGAPDEIIYFGSSINFNFAQGDYDGDGKTDVAYFVAPNGLFWYRSSANNNQAVIFPWGTAGDITIQYNR